VVITHIFSSPQLGRRPAPGWAPPRNWPMRCHSCLLQPPARQQARRQRPQKRSRRLRTPLRQAPAHNESALTTHRNLILTDSEAGECWRACWKQDCAQGGRCNRHWQCSAQMYLQKLATQQEPGVDFWFNIKNAARQAPNPERTGAAGSSSRPPMRSISCPAASGAPARAAEELALGAAGAGAFRPRDADTCVVDSRFDDQPASRITEIVSLAACPQ